MERWRRCFELRGRPAETAGQALTIVRPVGAARVLWVSDADGPPEGVTAVPRAGVKRLLGASFDVVVLDLHDGVDADVLGRCHGFIRGGGALVLRGPPEGVVPRPDPSPLAVFPYGAEDVGSRFWNRLRSALDRAGVGPPAEELAPVTSVPRGTVEQARVVDQLRGLFVDDGDELVALQADRGRGKSSALGLALGAALRERELQVVVTAPARRSADEVFLFLGDAPGADRVRFVPPFEALHRDPSPDVLVVDEAAQLPVPLLEALVHRHPRARIAFATTTRGYEGTGRGFVLRFLAWARELPRALRELALVEPIRWAKDDPLERLVFDALALDASPAPAESFGDPETALARARHVVLDRDALAADERLLHDLFGLLVHAHYRTTPSDLHRALDAPNLALHALLVDERVAAASLVAREGGLPAALCRELAAGQRRIRGHALPDNLVTHCGRPDAGALAMIRSVRIAVHPALRRHGFASRLVDEVHATWSPDLFGTLFGATADLLSFRRSVGYELVRLGVSRGSRTGEPAAVMVRPVSSAARALTAELREDLARSLPLQLELLAGEGELLLDARLEAALRAGLPTPAPLDAEHNRAYVARYASGPQPFEAAAFALEPFARAADLSALDDAERTLIEERLLAHKPWDVAAHAAGFPSVPAAMRAMRPAIRALLAIDGHEPAP